MIPRSIVGTIQYQFHVSFQCIIVS